MLQPNTTSGVEVKELLFFSSLSYTLFHLTPPSNFAPFNWVPSNLRRPPLNSTLLIFCLPIDIIDIDIIFRLLVFLENQKETKLKGSKLVSSS